MSWTGIYREQEVSVFPRGLLESAEVLVASWGDLIEARLTIDGRRLLLIDGELDLLPSGVLVSTWGDESVLGFTIRSGGGSVTPDDRLRQILTEAAAVGNATARAICFRNRDPQVLVYEDRRWTTAFVGGDYRWLRDDGNGGRHLDARTLFFYLATVNTPAMALKMVGVGSQYAAAMVDAAGNALHGSDNYRLHLPPDVPAKDFWSIVVYDPQTRSELQTGQPFPSRNNKRDELRYNDDGSVDIYFGSEPPAGQEHNWIQTVPGKGWFIILRLYGPLDAWFDHSWRPGDIEPA